MYLFTEITSVLVTDRENMAEHEHVLVLGDIFAATAAADKVLFVKELIDF